MLSVSSLSRKGFSRFIGIRALPKADAFELHKCPGLWGMWIALGSGNNTRYVAARWLEMQFL
jgi:hypothetical protein